MASVDDVDELIERYHQALRELVNGNPEPLKEIYSNRGDVSLANPFGPLVRGWDESARGMEGSASNYRDGEIAGFENVAKYDTSELDQPGDIGAWRGGCYRGVGTVGRGVRRGSGAPCDQQACAECERKDGGEHQAHRETRYCRCFLSTATVQVSQGRTHRQSPLAEPGSELLIRTRLGHVAPNHCICRSGTIPDGESQPEGYGRSQVLDGLWKEAL